MNNYQTDEIDDLIDLLNSGAPTQSQQSPVEQMIEQYSVAKNKQSELQKINDDLKRQQLEPVKTYKLEQKQEETKPEEVKEPSKLDSAFEKA